MLPREPAQQPDTKQKRSFIYKVQLRDIAKIEPVYVLRCAGIKLREGKI